MFYFLMIRPPPRSTRTDTRFPSTPLFRAPAKRDKAAGGDHQPAEPDQRDERLPPDMHLPAALGVRLAEHRIKLPVPQGAYLVEARSEEHTSELQSLMRNSYAVFCWKKKNNNNNTSKTLRSTHTHMRK